MNTAQYCTLPESLFGQHYEIEALISEFEVSHAVWKALITQVNKIKKKILSSTEIVIFYRFLDAESENDNKNFRLALIFKLFSILVFYE